MRDAVFALMWAGLLPLCFLSPHVGVLLWLWVALLPPSDFFYGFMAAIPFNKLIAVVTLGLAFFTKEKRDTYLDSTILIALIFGFSATLSWAFTIAPTSYTTDLYQKLLKILVLMFVLTFVMSTRYRLHLAVVVTALSYGFLGVKEAAIFLLTAGGHQVAGTGSIGDNNSLATALLMIVPFLYYLSRHTAVPAIRIGMAAALGLCLVATVATFSRGGFIGLIIVAALAVANSERKLVPILAVAVAVPLIYAMAPDAWFERLSTIRTAEADGSFLGRVNAWKVSWLVAMDHPFLGGGMHAIQNQAVWDAYKVAAASVGFVETPPVEDNARAAHSIYFEMLGDVGFVGLGLFLLLIASALWNCHVVRRAAKTRPELRWASDLARMMQISLIVYLVTGAALSLGYAELLYVFLALSSRCRRTVKLAIQAEASSTRARMAASPAGAWRTRALAAAS